MSSRFEMIRMRWMEDTRLRLALLAVALWGISALLLFPNLGYPRQIVFDETYMIPRAQRYMQGIFFQESHPPLGRLAIALGQVLVHPGEKPDQFALVEKVHESWPQDQDMTGYRLIPAIFGTLIPVLTFFILVQTLKVELFSFLLSLFVAFDNALLTQSHYALSDSVLIGFCLLAILFFVMIYKNDELVPGREIRLMWTFWAVASAAATLVKFSAWFILILIPIYLLKLYLSGERRQIVPFSGIFAAAFLLTWLIVWQVHFSLVPKFDPNSNYEISAEHQDILEGKSTPDPATRFVIQLRDALWFISHYHEGVPKLDLAKPGEIGSPWFQWPVGGRAINYRWETPEGEYYRYVYLIGNPGTWLISLLGVLGGTGLTIADSLFGFLPSERRRWLYIFTLLYWAYMIPPMFVQRVLYLYHYLPPLIIGVFLFGLVIVLATRLTWRTKLNIFLIALACVFVGFWLFKPFTYYQPLTDEQFQQRNVWPAWDLRCAKCTRGGQ